MLAGSVVAQVFNSLAPWATAAVRVVFLVGHDLNIARTSTAASYTRSVPYLEYFGKSPRGARPSLHCPSIQNI
jgi:hypothetical protein